MMKRLLSISVAVFLSAFVMAQAPRTAYHTDGFAYNHELNPALQPDSSYLSLPILGNTSISLSSSMQMKDILFDMPGNSDKLTLFTTEGTISKADLLKSVGKGMKTGFDTRLTLISIGKRINTKRYRTIEAGFRAQASTFIPKTLFSMVKDVENGTYNIDGLNINATAFGEVSYGGSFRLDEKWTIGGKIKLLAGIMNADAKVDNFNINIDGESNWTAQGNVSANVSGLEYKTETKEYSSRTNADGIPKTYDMVNSVEIDGIGLNGLGLAIDAGAEYKPNQHWSFSAAIRDLGFIHWFKSQKAENSGEEFEFDGFQNISKDGDKTLKSQWNNLKDDFMDMIHIEDKGSSKYTKMLNCTAEASAKYQYSIFTAGILYTANFLGSYTWMETRLNLGIIPVRGLNIVVSPNYGTYGFSVGGMINYHHKGFCVFLASDRLFCEVNKQMIPTSLNAGIQFGMTFPL